ncbi:MAG: DegV family protein [Dehalococcoidia bacterium]|jgi:DegV family protein with EDD domain
MPVAIVTDTVACLPRDVIENYKIRVVPLEVIYKGRVYRDGIDLTASSFYQMFADSDELATTSAPPPETFLEIYEELAAEGKDVLVICPSTKLTHVYESATIAARLFKEKAYTTAVEVLDSGTAAGAQGFVVMDAALQAQDSGNLDGVLQVARDAMQDVHVVVFLETLEYLARGGRVPQVVAWANSLLKIKPIIELRPLGRGVMLLGRARSRQKAMAQIVEILKHRTGSQPFRAMIQHTNAAEEANVLSQEISRRPSCRQVYIQDFTPVMGVHTGPGLVGLSYSTYVPTKIEN